MAMNVEDQESQREQELEEEEESEIAADSLLRRSKRGGAPEVGQEGSGSEEAQRLPEVAADRRSIYFDPNEGKWKCRHCDWSEQVSSPTEGETPSHEVHYQIAEEFKLLAQSETREIVQLGAGEEPGKVNEAVADIFKFSSPQAYLTNGHLDTTHLSLREALIHRSTAPEISSFSDAGAHLTNIEGPRQAVDDSKSRINLEEFDLERILKEQDTHDLFCPSCNSCITKRVIVRKRKRTVEVQRGEPPKKLQGEVQQVDITESVEPEEREVFRCLSCFSFFFPNENGGFSIFNIFGRRKEAISQQSSEQSSANCCPSLFSCFEGPGDLQDSQREGAPSDLREFAGEDNMADQMLWPVNSHSAIEQQEGTSSSSQDQSTLINPSIVASDDEKALQRKKFEAPFVSARDPDFTISGETKSSMQKAVSVTNLRTLREKQKLGYDAAADVFTSYESNPGVKKVSSVRNLRVLQETQPVYSLPDDDDLPISVSPGMWNEQAVLLDKSTSTVHRGDTVVDVDGELSSEEASQEVLKAIVYGGLTESITSLCILSAAAGANVATGTIFVLGVAYLIGGLLILIHKTWELRSLQDVHEDPEHEEQDEQMSSYWAQLGRRSRFGLHIAVAIASHIVFGMVPLVIYTFTFRDDREYKLISVAAASLSSIGLLAIAKAQVSPAKDYIVTLISHLGFAIATSGLAYFVAVELANLMLHAGFIAAAFSRMIYWLSN